MIVFIKTFCLFALLVFSASVFSQSPMASALVRDLYTRIEAGDTKAIDQLKGIAESGDFLAQAVYGRLLLVGKGTNKDEAAGIKWSMQGARLGLGPALRNIAYAHENGLGGLPKSPENAAIIYSFLVAKGSKTASDETNRIRLIELLSPGSADEVSKMAARLNSPSEMFAAIEKKTQKSGSSLLTNAKASANADGDFSQNGLLWTDRKTGLTWAVCPQRTTVVKDICEIGTNSDNSLMNWHEAIKYVQKLNFAGYGDWRIPSVKELETVLECRDIEAGKTIETKVPFELEKYDDTHTAIKFYRCKRGYLKFKDPLKTTGYNGSEWTSTSAVRSDVRPYGFDAGSPEDFAKHVPRVMLRSGYFQGQRGVRLSIEEMNYFRLVRGGSDTREWVEAIEDIRIVDAIPAADELARQKLAQREAGYAQEKRNAEVAQQEYWTNEIKRLRANVKKGDKVFTGTVLEVKGDKILVQGKKLVCAGRINPNTRLCNASDMVPVDFQQWEDRSAILPEYKTPAQALEMKR